MRPRRKHTPTNDVVLKLQSSSVITKAEVLFPQFVAEHSLSASITDHFTDLVKVMFPDSKPF